MRKGAGKKNFSEIKVKSFKIIILFVFVKHLHLDKIIHSISARISDFEFASLISLTIGLIGRESYHN